MGRTPLRKVADNILRALECPEEGFVFDDFDARYRKKDQKRETDSAACFYRNKTSFESIYEKARDVCGDEPAWVSDRGRGRNRLIRSVSDAVDRAERERLWDEACERVKSDAPECLTTLKLIRKNRSNRKESIWELAQEENASSKKENKRKKRRNKHGGKGNSRRKSGYSRGENTPATSKSCSPFSASKSPQNRDT